MSSVGTKRISRAGLAMSVVWLDRKSPGQGQTVANDPMPTFIGEVKLSGMI
jgi:hypothetical protein